MYSVIVKRGDFERYDLLYKTFGSRVPILWDRRRHERRKSDSPPETSNRRKGARRGVPPPSWLALGFVVIDV